MTLCLWMRARNLQLLEVIHGLELSTGVSAGLAIRLRQARVMPRRVSVIWLVRVCLDSSVVVLRGSHCTRRMLIRQTSVRFLDLLDFSSSVWNKIDFLRYCFLNSTCVRVVRYLTFPCAESVHYDSLDLPTAARDHIHHTCDVKRR